MSNLADALLNAARDLQRRLTSNHERATKHLSDEEADLTGEALRDFNECFAGLL